MGPFWKRFKDALRWGNGRSSGQRISVSTGSPRDAGESMNGLASLLPVSDLYDGANDFLLRVDIPGATTANTTIRGHGRRLSLHVAIDASSSQKILGEWPMDWRREFELPEVGDAERAECTLQDGVLTIRVPKKFKAEPRRIAIRVS